MPFASRSATVNPGAETAREGSCILDGSGINRRGGCAGMRLVAPLSVLSAGLARIQHLARDVVEPQTLSLLVQLLGGPNVTLLSVGAG